MILKALYDYYDRLKAFDGSVAPLGFKEQEIHFLIVIDQKGNFVRVEDRRIDKKRSQQFFVISDSRSSGIKPYVFYDNMEYVFGHPKDDNKNTVAKAPLTFKAFVQKCNDMHEKYAGSKAFSAVCAFYAQDEYKKVCEDALWNEMTGKIGAVISFLIQGETEIVASAKELENETKLQVESDHTLKLPVCLVTGEPSIAVETTSATMIPGSQATAKLVAFQVNSGYDSYGKKQGANAPISVNAEAAYTTALLRLLDKQSKNKFSIGNRTFLFWASSANETSRAIEESVFALFGITDDKSDDPNRRIDTVRKTFEAIYSGKMPCKSDDKFYILGLAPNSARIAVVYWNETTVHDFAIMILQHFNDMEIVDGRKEKRPYYGLRQMMSAVTLNGKASEVQPNLPEATIKSILQGLPYPYTLYSSAIRRIRAEQGDSMQIARMAIIKAYLNRLNDNNKKIEVMLDKGNNNSGYVCGRLFAVLEYSQKSANNINTIRERYMNAASATPAAVFATLLNLNVHHVEKFENDGKKIYIETLKQEIVSLLPANGFPPHLDLQDQGRFFVGYYHQMQELYSPKTKENEQ
ncbi:MAG: type I-C CRISPR-associated protein Cas8c/Csd1 [Bacteroidaceae bacterium]|nr:type I-C CRISPR-associated protein Cas8c/Csd1 [Bacteroidaceae bacterium]